MTEVGLRIRVDDGLRRAFISTCKANDMTAAQVLRAHMRSFVETYGADGSPVDKPLKFVEAASNDVARKVLA